MKGKITIDFKYDKEDPNGFSQEVTMKKVTVLHIATAISKLTELLEMYATDEDKIRLASVIRTESNEKQVIVIKTQGDA
jgi:hypothetical protein